MTRKHFELLAQAIADSLPAGASQAEIGQHTRTVYTVANALRSTNPNFDHGKFVFACGLGKIR